MAQQNDIKYREFDSDLQAALRDFLKFEERHGGVDEAPAVRAGQFNEFVTLHYPRIRNAVTPDICEAYLQRFHYLTLPLDEEPEEPLTPQQRHAKASLAYSEFWYDVGFKGSQDAEALAFHAYVHTKYPLSLPDFSEGEAASTIAACRAKKNSTMLGVLLSVVCAAGLAGIFMGTPQQGTEKPRRAPSRQRTRDLEDRPRVVPYAPVNPAVYPVTDDTQWRDRIQDPALLRKMEQERQRQEREWRSRHVDGDGNGQQPKR